MYTHTLSHSRTLTKNPCFRVRGKDSHSATVERVALLEMMIRKLSQYRQTTVYSVENITQPSYFTLLEGTAHRLHSSRRDLFALYSACLHSA